MLYNGKFKIHKEYRKCSYYKHFEFFFAENQEMFITTVDSGIVSISYLHKIFEGVDLREQTFSKGLPQIYSKYLFVLNSQSSPVLIPQKGIKLVNTYSFAIPGRQFIIDNSDPMVFNINAPPTCAKIEAIYSTDIECLYNHIPDDRCHGQCRLETSTEICLKCLKEYISTDSGQNCISIDAMAMCEGHLPVIFPYSSCKFKISRSGNSLSVKITDSELENFCIFVLDAGNSRKEFLIKKNPGRYSYTPSLILYDEIHIQRIKLQANQILFRGEGHTVKLVMPHPSDSEIKFESYDAFHRSFRSTELCIICNTMGSIPDLSFSALHSSPSERVGHWKFSNEESYCESKSRLSQGFFLEEWYECLTEFEEEQGGICTRDLNDPTKIVLDKASRVPFCKMTMSLNPDQTLILAIELQAYEDLVLEFKGTYLPYRDHQKQGKMLISYDKLSGSQYDTPEEFYLYFVSQRPEETLKREEFIKIEKKHSISIDRYLRLTVTVMILLLILLLLCTFVMRIADDYRRKLSIQTIKCPYEAAKFKRGNPKELLLDEFQLEALKKTGIEFTIQGVPVEVEGRDCEVCLHPLKDKDYRIYLCGIHFTHVDCFRHWLKKRPKGQANLLCPNKCTKILIPPHLSVILDGISVEITQEETYTEDTSNSSTSTRKNSNEENSNTAPNSARNSGKKVAPENPPVEEEGEAPGDIIILPMKKPHTLTHNLPKRPPQLGVYESSSESTESGSPTKKLNGSSEEGSPNITHEGRQREMANMLADVLMELGEDGDMSVVGFSRNTSEGLPLIK